jgi:DNA-binding MurR/RpiR family transcriptional regulator
MDGSVEPRDRSSAVEAAQLVAATRPDPTIALRSMVASLTPAERRAAQVILAAPDDVVHMSITQLGAAAHVSESTIVRLSTRLGYRGFVDLKIAIAQSADRGQPVVVGNVVATDNLTTIVHKVLAAEVRDIEETSKLLDLHSLDRCIRALDGSRRVLAYGAGPSSFVALDLAQKLERVGLAAFGYNDPHLAIASASLVTEHDVAIAFSFSGRTRDTLTFLRAARGRGAETVAVTSSLRSPITEVASCTIVTASTESPFRMGATSSRIAQLCVVDVIFTALAVSRHDEAMARLVEAYNALDHERV